MGLSSFCTVYAGLGGGDTSLAAPDGTANVARLAVRVRRIGKEALGS
jgi:hypothetical protein